MEMIFFIESQHSATQFIHQISPGLWDGKPGCPSYRSTLERWAQTAVHMLCMDNHGHLLAMCVCVSTSEKCEGRMMVHAHRVHILHKYVNIHVLGLRTLNKERERVPPFQYFSVITALSVLLSAQWSGPVNPREDFSMIFYV